MIQIETVKINDIKFYEKNAKQHPKDQIRAIANSIKAFGFNVPVLLDKDNVLIAGHGRVLAAIELDMKELPAIHKKDLTPQQVRAYRIADNKVTESKWELGYLKEEIESLLQDKFDITLLGFKDIEIDSLLEKDKALKDITPEPIDKIKTNIKLGDMFRLGQHTLLCGDTTKEKDMKKVMQGAKASIVITDPPYGVSYQGINNPNGKKWDAMQGDDLRGKELYNMLYNAFKQAHTITEEEMAIYIFYASSNTNTFFKALQNAGYTNRQQIIWAKGHILGHSDYHWSHEPIIYASKQKRSPWYADRTHKTCVIQERTTKIKEKTKEQLIQIIMDIRTHSTIQEVSKGNVQPIELYARFLANNTKKGQHALDMFAGSGPLIIAGDQLQRTCHLIEIDPRYCQVIINRWEKLTGRKAEKVLP